ncbi:MFS transporter [Amycolatopsis nigrescens]|uniref:MFS transporter n=1 Tax=Amycolatopsis nigrescens TaxID=381445 RepID=UPI00037DEFB0|nr:MFS transporter [Amycolatopsis nigrescens]
MTTQLVLPPPTKAAERAGLSSAGLITVLLGAALPLIDFFIVNVALPTINTDLSASTATLELVVAGYGIAYALFLVVGGRLGDTFGRRRLFMIGLTAFTVSSLACGLAPSVETLVLARVAQGGSAALMLPQVLSIIQAGTTGERRSKALGLYGATGGISTVIGQLLGGVLVSADIAGTGWRPIFLVNVPIGLLGLVLARRALPESRSTHPMGVDRWGTALFGVAMLALLIPLMEGHALGWPLWSWLLLAVFPFALAGFVVVERRLERDGGVPLLPPSVLRMPSMRRGLAVGAPFFTGFGGFMFVYAVTLQDGLHLGPMGSGLALTPMAAGFFATSLVSGRLVARYGHRVVIAGAGVQLLGILTLIAATLLAWPELSALGLAPGMLLCGIGQGMAMTTLFRVVLSRVPTDRAGVGSGVLTTVQQTCLALGVATLGTLFASLSVPGALGMESAFVLVLGVQALLTTSVIWLSRTLPDPRG